VRLKLKFPKLGVRASIALIVLVIGLVGFIQYSWFRLSASEEIESAYHGLNATVLQTMSREFQRYAPLLADLRALAVGSETSTASRGQTFERSFKNGLEREYALYGPTGSVPRLLTLVGAVSVADPSSTSILDPDGAWKRVISPFALPVPEAAKRRLAVGGLVVCSGGEDRQFILVPAGSRYIAMIELDTDGFFEAYTKPAVAAVLPDSKIEWSRSAPGGARDSSRPRGIGPRRTFNPIRALFGGASKEGRTFSLVVPATMDSFLMRGLGWFDSWSPGSGGEGSYRPLQRGEGPDPRAAITLRSARILVSSNSVLGSMERRLALNWLFSILLLLGLGFAFAQAVIQNHKLGIVRRREREFVASVTHELRTPVTAIRSAADNMRRGIVGLERVAPYGEMIHAQSLRLGSMIEEVLLFSQVEGGTVQSPVLATLRPDELAQELRPPLDAIARAEGIRVEWDFGSLPREFLGDAETLRLVLSNLVTNALYHAYPGPEKGELRVIGVAPFPEAIRFLVEDDGRGIAKREAALVFDPFYRDEASRARNEKGSGLGLFIARHKARLLGGDLKLESPYSRIDGSKRPGCRFTLELPFKEAGDVR
jgi:signal transduction histidine kinase